jgi:transcriptional regulator with XRE-family HTH domain
MTYGQQLHARRKRLGLTQAGAALLLGVGVSTYRAWETDDPQRTPLAVTQEGALARLDAASAAPPEKRPTSGHSDKQADKHPDNVTARHSGGNQEV